MNITIYGHVDPATALQPGAKVAAGKSIGHIGAPRRGDGELTTGPHVHQQIVTQKRLDQLNEDAVKGRNPRNLSLSKGTTGGVGLLTGRDKDAFQDPRTFTGWADGAPFDTLSYGLVPRPRPDLGDRPIGDQMVVPPPESQRSFDDRFSDIYLPASIENGDIRGSGGPAGALGSSGNRDLHAAHHPDRFGPSIPFVTKPNGSLVAPGESSLLDPTPMDPGVPGPFSTGGRFVPRSSLPQPLYPTGPLVPASITRMQDREGSLEDRSGNWNSSPAEDADRFRSPVLRELLRHRQLAAAGVAAAPSSAAPNLGIPRTPSSVGSGAGDVTGGVFKWIGNGLIPSAEASSSKFLPQGGTATDFLGDSDGAVSNASEVTPPPARDNRRYLSRRVVGQGSAFDTGAPAVPFVPSDAALAPDHPNSFEDRFGNWSSSAGAAQPAQPARPKQASPPIGLFTGQPMPNRVVPLPIFDILDRSTVRGGSADDERESQGTGIPMLDEYIRYLNREYPS